jgi:hypothetical protein
MHMYHYVFAPLSPLSSTRQSGLRPDSAVPRSADCLVFTLLFSPTLPSTLDLFIRHHTAPLTTTLDRHFQVKAGIHFFESDLDLIAESDTTSPNSAATHGSC